MGRWLRGIGRGLLLRTIAQELRGIREQLTRQGDLLEQVLRAYAPDLMAQAAQTAQAGKATPSEVAETGISFLDQIEAGLVADYIERTTLHTGRAPSDEEILSYLADEKTTDLHLRLRQREALADLDRLQRTTGGER